MYMLMITPKYQIVAAAFIYKYVREDMVWILKR